MSWQLLAVIVLVKQLFTASINTILDDAGIYILFFIRWELPCKPYDPVCSGWISASSVMAFRQGVSKLAIFCAKNQQIHRKLLYFMNAMNEVCQKLGIVLEKNWLLKNGSYLKMLLTKLFFQARLKVNQIQIILDIENCL